MILRRTLPVFALVFLSVGVASAASPKQKAEARTLASEAKKAMKERRFADAETALRRADTLDSSPQIKLDLAAALTEDGKLVDASRVLHGVTDGTVASPATKRFHDAGKKLLAAIEPRIPWMQIDVGGPSAGSTLTTIDGKDVDAANEVPFDPGEHAVAVSADGFETATRNVTLREGAHEHVHLDLTPTPKAAPPKVAGGSKAPAITLFVLGGAGLLVGGGAGIAALLQANDAKAQCAGNVCPPSSQASIDKSKLSGTISTAGFIAGGALVGAGIIALIATPSGDPKKESPKEGARVTPWIGLGSAGLSGSF
ncbi:MAG: PEGA domain-containing protein [Byssovorax sp.]